MVNPTPAPVWIKICGITNLDDARAAFDLGADAIGINLIPSSKRAVPLELALKLATAVGRPESTIFVVADLPGPELMELRAKVGDAWLQLHGSEHPASLVELLPRAFKAIPIQTSGDAEQALGWPGQRLLVDAKVGAGFGGTGHAFDWTLVAGLAQARSLILAGGLHPENAAQAVAIVNPWGLDVASGVEAFDSPRRKDPDKIERFVKAARSVAG